MEVINIEQSMLHTIAKYENGIRKHRDQKGDDRCWLDDDELYRLLPEGYTPPEHGTCVMLQHCEQYIKMRHDPRVEYVSPQRRIEVLEKELARVTGESKCFYITDAEFVKLCNACSLSMPQPPSHVFEYIPRYIASLRAKIRLQDEHG